MRVLPVRVGSWQWQGQEEAGPGGGRVRRRQGQEEAGPESLEAEPSPGVHIAPVALFADIPVRVGCQSRSGGKGGDEGGERPLIKVRSPFPHRDSNAIQVDILQTVGSERQGGAWGGRTSPYSLRNSSNAVPRFASACSLLYRYLHADWALSRLPRQIPGRGRYRGCI
jgi:hypothetical protein